MVKYNTIQLNIININPSIGIICILYPINFECFNPRHLKININRLKNKSILNISWLLWLSITLSNIVKEHSSTDNIDSVLPESPPVDKLSSLLKTSDQSQQLPYTNYILGGGFFIFICIVLYNIYFYFVENKFFSKINNYFNPTPVNPKPVNPTPVKKTNE